MNKHFNGWSGKILEINLSTKDVQERELPEFLVYNYLGQSGINAYLLYKMTSPGMDALDTDAPLIFGVGPLGGTIAPCSGRFTATFKSPLTGIFADSNCGGHWGPELKMAGYDHIIITGRAEHPVYLWINNNQVEIRKANNIWGKNTWETDEIIKMNLAEKNAQIACIGPAGENLVKYAAIICNHSRAAARCGPGAVMGSKNLKAIAVRGDKGISVADPAAFYTAAEEAVNVILNDPLYETASTYGTTAITGLAQALGFLPTRNFQKSSFDGAKNLQGEVLKNNYVTGHKGCYNCPVSCSKFYNIEEGQYAHTKGEGPEYETISSFGSKCGNDNLESILHANMLCNQLGLDTISTGNTIAWAMECYEKGILDSEKTGGNLNWGNHKEIINLINKIAYKKDIGKILAEGPTRAAEYLGGSELVVQSKGLDYPAVDVRGTKGMALSFAVSTRGGDHLKGLPLYEVAPDVYAQDIKRLLGIEVGNEYWKKYKTKAKLIKWHEDWHCVVDSLGLCKLEGIALKPLLPEHFAKLLSAATGWEISIAQLEKIGERIWNLERLFNAREGLKKEDDYPPHRLLSEPISTGPAKGETLDKNKYEEMLGEYYILRGWDNDTGLPTSQKLTELDLYKLL